MMGQKRLGIKRPCRICRKWFIPNPRLGERQMTCGAAECQKQRHKRKCAEWNRRNRACSQENYLRKRLQIAVAAQSSLSAPQSPSSPPPFAPVAPLDYPRTVVQEVIGPQPLIIIEYIVRLLARGVQEAMRAQPSEIQRESSRLLPADSSRDDSQSPSLQGTLCHQT
jgi:hypothetical protein